MPSTNVTNALDNMNVAFSQLGMLAFLGFLAVALTVAMFMSKEPLLSFPSAIFWMVLGGYCYQQSATLWDIYYFMFFASAIGMTIFCVVVAFAIRVRNRKGQEVTDLEAQTENIDNADKDLAGDLGTNDMGNNGEKETMSRRTQGVRDRAARRRTNFGSRP